MKKVFSMLMVAVALMVAAPAQAQLIKFGVKGGMNFSKLDTDYPNLYEAKKNSTGFFIGPMAELTVPVVGLEVDAALMYAQMGDGEVKMQGLEIPLNLKYTIGLGSMFGIYLAAGPDFFFNFKDVEYGLGKKKSLVSINLGGGLKLLRKLQLGVNYQIPLKESHYPTEISLAPGAEPKNLGARQNTWQVSLAYIF